MPGFLARSTWGRGEGHARGNHTSMFFSLSFSLPPKNPRTERKMALLMAQSNLVAEPHSLIGISLAPPRLGPSGARHHQLHPHPYLDMAISEWAIQQLVAHILGFSLPASMPASRPLGFLAALGCLHCIQTPRLQTIGVRPGGGDGVHEQGHQRDGEKRHTTVTE